MPCRGLCGKWMFGIIKLFSGCVALCGYASAAKSLCLAGLVILMGNSASGQQANPSAVPRKSDSTIISVPQPEPSVMTGSASPSPTRVDPSAPKAPARTPGDTLPSGTPVQPAAIPAEGGTLPQTSLPAGNPPAAMEPVPLPTPVPAPVAVTIDLAKQRAYLLRGGVVELEAPVSSGRAGHLTPIGEFSVLEKDLNHKSTLYGKFVKSSNGKVVQRNAQSNMPAPAGARFEGAPMKFFIRFEGAAGTHAGSLPGYPASHGCVRMPAAKAEAFYNAVKIGTPVRVFGQAPVRKSYGEEKKNAKPAASKDTPKTAAAAPAPKPTPTPKPKRAWWPFGKHE